MKTPDLPTNSGQIRGFILFKTERNILHKIKHYYYIF